MLLPPSGDAPEPREFLDEMGKHRAKCIAPDTLSTKELLGGRRIGSILSATVACPASGRKEALPPVINGREEPFPFPLLNHGCQILFREHGMTACSSSWMDIALGSNAIRVEKVVRAACRIPIQLHEVLNSVERISQIQWTW